MLTNGNLILNSALLTIYNQITGQKSGQICTFGAPVRNEYNFI